MVDLPSNTDPERPFLGRDAGPPSMPGWVKIALVITIAVVAILVVLLLTGGAGGHSPARH